MGLFSPSVTQAESTSTTNSGSSSSSSQTPYQQEQYKQLLGQAQNLYEQGMPQYYGGPTVAGMTPAQLESMNLTSNWVTGGAQDMMGLQNKNYMDMMSGRVNTGAGSPYADMKNMFVNQASDSANQVMQNVRGNQVMSGQYGGSSAGDKMNDRVLSEANKSVTNNLAGMYNNAYNQAQSTRNNALGQYGSIMNMPMQMSAGLYNQVGLPQQQLNQRLMDDAKQRYDYNSMLPYKNLDYFKNAISGNMGGSTSSSGGGSSTTTSSRPVVGPSTMDNIQQVAGIAGTIMGISDERLKENIKYIGKSGEHNVYSWDWNEEAKSIGVRTPNIGVIAQEVLKIKPDAVSINDNGYLQVNYGAL